MSDRKIDKHETGERGREREREKERERESERERGGGREMSERFDSIRPIDRKRTLITHTI